MQDEFANEALYITLKERIRQGIAVMFQQKVKSTKQSSARRKKEESSARRKKEEKTSTKNEVDRSALAPSMIKTMNLIKADINDFEKKRKMNKIAELPIHTDQRQ